MKILPITNFNISKSSNNQRNITFKASEDIYDRAEKVRLIEDEYPCEKCYEALNTEYVPVELDSFYNGPSRSMILPSQRYIKHQSSFRDEELFDDEYDITSYQGPESYDIDDVPIREDLWLGYTKNNANEYYYGIDTYLLPEEINSRDAVWNPWVSECIKKEEEEDEQFKRDSWHAIHSVPGSDPKIANDIFKKTTLITNGKPKINQDLCKLAIALYQNSEEWSDTEKKIIKEVKIPLYQSVYIDYSTKKLKAVKNCLIMDYSNEKILDYLKRHYPGMTYKDLDKIFTKEELESLM